MPPVSVGDREQQVEGDEQRSPHAVLPYVVSLVGEQAAFDAACRHDHEADRHRHATGPQHQPCEPSRRAVEKDEARSHRWALEREEPGEETEQRVRRCPDEPQPDGHGLHGSALGPDYPRARHGRSFVRRSARRPRARDRARRPLRRLRPRVVPRGRERPRSLAGTGRERSRLRYERSPDRDDEGAPWLGGPSVLRGRAVRHRGGDEGRDAPRDHDVPPRGLRRATSEAGGHLREGHRDRSGPTRLHDQRHGGPAPRWRAHRSVRWGESVGVARPGHTDGSADRVLRRSVADDPRRAVRGAARGRACRARPRRDPLDARSPRHRGRRADAGGDRQAARERSSGEGSLAAGGHRARGDLPSRAAGTPARAGSDPPAQGCAPPHLRGRRAVRA